MIFGNLGEKEAEEARAKTAAMGGKLLGGAAGQPCDRRLRQGHDQSVAEPALRLDDRKPYLDDRWNEGCTHAWSCGRRAGRGRAAAGRDRWTASWPYVNGPARLEPAQNQLQWRDFGADRAAGEWTDHFVAFICFRPAWPRRLSRCQVAAGAGPGPV